MVNSVTVHDMFNGTCYGEIVSGIDARLNSEIENLTTALLSNASYTLPDFSDVRIQSEIMKLWEDEDLNLPKLFASPKIKELLINDTYSRLVESAYGATVFYDLFSPDTQDVLIQFLDDIPEYLGVFSNKIQSIVDSLSPKSYRSEYAYVITYALFLALLPLIGSCGFMPIGRLGGIRGDSLPLLNQTYMRIFLDKLSATFSGDTGRYIEYLFGYLTIGVVNDIDLDILATCEKYTLRKPGQYKDIVDFTIREYPPEAVILIASKLCPLLFAENYYTRLHILCRLLWSSLDIYPERTIKIWLPFGYIDMLSGADMAEKIQNEILALPRLAEAHRFKQIREVLQKSNVISALDLSNSATNLLKFQVYNAILRPLLENLAYNRATLRILESDFAAKSLLGKLLFEGFREECLVNTKLRDRLLAGDVSALVLEKTKSNLTKLLDIREKFITQTILQHGS